ncbi:MAG: type II toxin-antitoxin system RelE/ParE family toxin [Gammaproteobacteria bacterium]|nr:type II toxin-antitoxin system RelE/ParE family toxin [Gammaproteobacteria bacterium]
MKQLVFYETLKGDKPFQKWLMGLKDKRGQSLILACLDRLLLGHYGDCKSLKRGLYELRIAYGPGYRIYFAKLRSGQVVLLLAGGSKRTQQRDIERAIGYWEAFKARCKNEKGDN